MAPMASTLYGAAHGYESVPSELPSTAYETSTLPRPRRRTRVGKVLVLLAEVEADLVLREAQELPVAVAEREASGPAIHEA